MYNEKEIKDIKNIKETIIKIIQRYSNESIDDNTVIIDEEHLLIDSLNIMRFICEVEEAFQIDDLIIRDVTLSNFKSVSSLTNYILRIKGGKKYE